MSKVYIPSSGPDDWQRFLAEPEKQWRRGFSARTVAYSWEAANGFPPEIEALFVNSGVNGFQEVELLIAIPEYKVLLPPIQGHPSQNDVFALAKAAHGRLIALAVEAKVSEPFGPTFDEWRANATPGKTEREEFLRSKLGLKDRAIGPIRYQLMHRLASALLEAERFNADHAALIVHSFSQQDEWFNDFSSFLALYGAKGRIGELVRLGVLDQIPTYAGWARGDKRFLDS
ncbi:MAG: hypothetical protein ABSB61_07605 [Anaerolineales bacterium]|jgi:hypothetical protein